jgi:hypothetical protein
VLGAKVDEVADVFGYMFICRVFRWVRQRSTGRCLDGKAQTRLVESMSGSGGEVGGRMGRIEAGVWRIINTERVLPHPGPPTVLSQ